MRRLSSTPSYAPLCGLVLLLCGCGGAISVKEAVEQYGADDPSHSADHFGAPAVELALELKPGPGWMSSFVEVPEGNSGVSAVGYAHDSGANLTLFEYPCSRPCSERAAEEMKKSTHAILNFENRKGWRTVRLLNEGTTQLGGETPNVQLARFRVLAGKREHVSKLLVWCKQDYIYKLRVTYPKEDLAKAAVADMLRTIGNAGFRQG